MVIVNHCGLPYGADDVDMKKWKEGEIYRKCVCMEFYMATYMHIII